MKSSLSILGLITMVISLFSLLNCKESTKGNTSHITENQNISDTVNQGEGSGNRNKYKMNIVSHPDIINAGKPVVFSLTPQISGNETVPVPLDRKNGYEINLILVSGDLSWFDHRHPGLSDLGSYEQSYTFNKGGLYTLIAEYKPSGSKDTNEIRSFGVNGSSDLAAKYSAPKLTSTAGPYELSVSTGQQTTFQSGSPQPFSIAVTKGGVALDPATLGDYMGGKGHLVIIKVKDMDFMHLYPQVEGGKFSFMATFPSPGFYRAWLQFQSENIVETADFVFEVK
jgi:hypothetical protein